MTKKLEQRRDELALMESETCYCAGFTCSGCGPYTQKLIKFGFNAAVEELQPQIDSDTTLNVQLAEDILDLSTANAELVEALKDAERELIDAGFLPCLHRIQTVLTKYRGEK